MLTRYTIFNSLFAFGIAYAVYFFDAFNWLVQADPTRFTFLILGIYLLCSVYLGVKRELANFKLIKWIAQRLTAIGLVGTVIGIMMLLASIGVLNLADVQDVTKPIFAGMATCLLTTLFGMSLSLLLEFQMAYVFRNYDNDEQTD